MPIEEVLPKLANAKLFSVLDTKDGFHQGKLDEPSLDFGMFGYHSEDTDSLECHLK